MKPKPEQLWKHLVRAASPPLMDQASEDEVSRIVTHLHWQPGRSPFMTWEETLWPLLLRFALPCAAAILLITAALPSPDRPSPSDSVDDLIASIIPQP
jgi:hypothetical protein